MSTLLLRGARVIDPANGVDGVRDVWVENGRVTSAQSGVGETRDVSGCWLFPALTDLRCVLRGQDDITDALAGGFARVVADASSSRALKSDGLDVLFSAEITKGHELVERPPGVLCQSNGFMPIATAGLLRRALQSADGRLLMIHAEDASLSVGTVLGEGPTSLRLGLAGSPPAAETVAVAAALAVLEGTTGRVHFSHLTCRGSLDRVAAAKRAGLKVTADATPHHLRFDDSKADAFSLDARVWPVLRGMADVEALRLAAQDGTVDAVATDHARPSALDREHPYEQAAWGRASARTAFADVIAAGITPSRAVALFTSGPASVLGLEAPSLAPGAHADLAIFDPAAARMRYTFLKGAAR